MAMQLNSCQWKVSKSDEFKLDFEKSLFLGIYSFSLPISNWISNNYFILKPNGMMIAHYINLCTFLPKIFLNKEKKLYKYMDNST